MEMDNFREESTMGRVEYRVLVRAPQKQEGPGGLEYVCAFICFERKGKTQLQMGPVEMLRVST